MSSNRPNRSQNSSWLIMVIVLIAVAIILIFMYSRSMSPTTDGANAPAINSTATGTTPMTNDTNQPTPDQTTR